MKKNKLPKKNKKIIGVLNNEPISDKTFVFNDSDVINETKSNTLKIEKYDPQDNESDYIKIDTGHKKFDSKNIINILFIAISVILLIIIIFLLIFNK